MGTMEFVIANKAYTEGERILIGKNGEVVIERGFEHYCDYCKQITEELSSIEIDVRIYPNMAPIRISIKRCEECFGRGINIPQELQARGILQFPGGLPR
jgi:hypothetical protein